MLLKHCMAQELFSKHWKYLRKVLRWQYRLPDSSQALWGLSGEKSGSWFCLSFENSKPFLPQIPNICSLSSCSVYFFMSHSYSTSFHSLKNSKKYDDDALVVKIWNSHKRPDLWEHIDRHTLDWNMFSTSSLKSKWTWAKDSALAFCQSRGDTTPYTSQGNLLRNRFARDFRQPPTDFNSN